MLWVSTELVSWLSVGLLPRATLWMPWTTCWCVRWAKILVTATILLVEVGLEFVTVRVCDRMYRLMNRLTVRLLTCPSVHRRLAMLPLRWCSRLLEVLVSRCAQCLQIRVIVCSCGRSRFVTWLVLTLAVCVSCCLVQFDSMLKFPTGLPKTFEIVPPSLPSEPLILPSFRSVTHRCRTLPAFLKTDRTCELWAVCLQGKLCTKLPLLVTRSVLRVVCRTVLEVKIPSTVVLAEQLLQFELTQRVITYIADLVVK